MQMVRLAKVDDAVQLKKSFCYNKYMPEITEVYVKSEYRQKEIAKSMIVFAEKYCKKNIPFHKLELLKGKNNLNAQALYNNLRYQNDGEIHIVKDLDYNA